MNKLTAPVRIDISGGWPDSDPYRKDFGGAVLNAAINLRVSGYLDDSNLSTSLGEIPHGSGLGTSGALRAVYLGAANNNLLDDKRDLVRRVHLFENEVIGHRAGFQDEAAAIHGGVNYWEFGKNDSIIRVPISKESAQHLEDSLVLVYTGKSHLSANIHDLVFGPGNYEKNIPKLDRMKQIAKEMVINLTNQDIMSRLINETWELQKSLHESIETDTMRKVLDYTKGLYFAARATGAGSGGCMILHTDIKDHLLNVTKEKIEKDIPGIKFIPFKFDYEGIRTEKK